MVQRPELWSRVRGVLPALTERAWHRVREGITVKLLPHQGECYVFAQSASRIDKERAMRRRQLKQLWKRLPELRQMKRLTRDQLLMKLGAARQQWPTAWRLVAIRTPQKDEEVNEQTSTWRLRKKKLRQMRRREGRYLLRTNLTEEDPCSICRDPGRDASLIVVVEQPKDVMLLEQTGLIRGVYHVLMGHIAPLEGVEPGDLTIDALVERVRRGGVGEVLLATNPTMEGDGTALHLQSILNPFEVTVSRLARGLAVGSQVEYASRAMLEAAITGRTPMP